MKRAGTAKKTIMILALLLLPAAVRGGEVADHLIGKKVTEPVTVQGGKLTIVSGNIFVNNKIIREHGDSRAAMLLLRTPAKGGRIVFHGNRLINRGVIAQENGRAGSGMVVVHRTTGRRTTIYSSDNRFLNRGLVYKR